MVTQGDGDMREYYVHPSRLFKDMIRDGRTMTAYRDSFWVIDAGDGWYASAFVQTIWRLTAEGD